MVEPHQLFIDKIIRNKIFQSNYYKQKCFGLNASTLIDRALQLKSIGGTISGTRKPTPFLCLLQKLLQINPEPSIIQKYLQSDYKYLTALSAFYIRLTFSHLQVYSNLQPLLTDYRRLKFRQPDTTLSVLFMDEYIDNLLQKQIYFDIALPHLPKRYILQQQGLPPRHSILQPTLSFEQYDQQTPEIQQKPKKRPKIQKAPIPESLQYWNQKRAEMGLPPLRAYK